MGEWVKELLIASSSSTKLTGFLRDTMILEFEELTCLVSHKDPVFICEIALEQCIILYNC